MVLLLLSMMLLGDCEGSLVRHLGDNDVLHGSWEIFGFASDVNPLLVLILLALLTYSFSFIVSNIPSSC